MTKYLLIFLIFGIQGCSQTFKNDLPQTKPVINTGLKDWYRLKGPIKEIRSFTYLQTGAKKNNKKDYPNEIGRYCPSFLEFNRSNRIVKRVGVMDSIDQPLPQVYKGATHSLYINEYESISKAIKQKWATGISNPYPVRAPIEVYLDYKRFSPIEIQKDSTDYRTSSWEYDLNDQGQVIESREFLGYVSNSGLRKLLQYTSLYEYNDKGQLIKKQIIPDKSRPLSHSSVLLDDLEFPVHYKPYYIYEYDAQDRLQRFVLWAKPGVAAYWEEYTYDDQNRPTTLYRFHSSTYNSRPDRIKFKLDTLGNPVEEHWLDEQKNIQHSQYYVYQYDNYNNWTQCDMYMDGHKDSPTVIAKRRISYYEE